MKLIIDIPEKTIAHIRSDYGHGVKCLYDTDKDIIVDSIWNGIPLPKGHGRLIDADELFDKIQFADFSSSDDVNTALFSISDAPTIIEADKGE